MKNKFRKQIEAAFFAAIIAVITLISIPTPTGIPLTFQTFAIALCGFTLGKKYGLIAVLIWLTVGIIGLPVFSGMTGGIGQLLGPTGGFLVGFIPMVILCDTKRSHLLNLLIAVTGLILCHLLGALWFSVITKASVISAIITASLPYFIKDILLTVAAYGTASMATKRLKT